MALSITLLIVTSLTGMYHVYQYALIDTTFNEDIYIAAKQISQYVLGTTCVEIDDHYTYMDFQGRNMTFQYDKGRLVKTPGYEIMLYEIDDIEFERVDDYIYLIIRRHKKDYKFLINFYSGEDNEQKQEDIQME